MMIFFIKFTIMNITALSDTHGRHQDVKFDEKQLAADMLIYGGDFTLNNYQDPLNSEIKKQTKIFLNWLSRQPQKYKILIGGNHDFFAERKFYEFKEMLPSNIIYLNNETVEIEGLKIFGSPNTAELPGWAFGDWEKNMSKYYDKIPDDVDILVTHTPPYGILDLSSSGNRYGSTTLLEKMKSLKPKINMFGHVHESYGTLIKDDVLYANVNVYNGKAPSYFEI